MGLGIIILLGLYLLRRRLFRFYVKDRANESSEMASLPRTRDQRTPQEVSTEQQWEMDGNGKTEVDGVGRLEMEAR